MRYETAKAFRTALEQRLKNEAQVSDIALLRLRKRVAFERFLARLATSESSGWVLKGAFALELRLGLRARTTKDIDLGRADDEEAATEHLEAATHVPMTRTELHRLVDALPTESLPAAAMLRQRAQDPVAAKLDGAPYDDEELTDEELRAVKKPRSEIMHLLAGRRDGAERCVGNP